MRNNFSIFYVLEALGLTYKKIFQSIKRKKFLLQAMKVTEQNLSLNRIEKVNENNMRQKGQNKKS